MPLKKDPHEWIIGCHGALKDVEEYCINILGIKMKLKMFSHIVDERKDVPL